MQDNSKDFQLDDPVCIKGKVTPERAVAIIDRINALLKAEREELSKSWQPFDPYRGMR